MFIIKKKLLISTFILTSLILVGCGSGEIDQATRDKIFEEELEKRMSEGFEEFSGSKDDKPNEKSETKNKNKSKKEDKEKNPNVFETDKVRIEILGASLEGDVLSPRFKIKNKGNEPEHIQMLLLLYTSFKQDLGDTTVDLSYAMFSDIPEDVTDINSDLNPGKEVEIIYPIEVESTDADVQIHFKENMFSDKTTIRTISLK